MEKKCSKCKEVKDIKYFGIRRKSTTGYQAWCKRCACEDTMRRYRENPKPFQINNKKVKSRGAKFVAEYLSTRFCADCGDARIIVLEFDHLPQFKKLYTIAVLAGQGNIPKLIEEIKKCEVVCANCHRIRHSIRDKWEYKLQYVSREKP